MALVTDDKRKHVGIGLGAGALGLLYSLDPSRFIEFFSVALGHQLVQFSLIFSLAAMIHRRGMKKDMGAVTEAIISLGDALRAELKEMKSEIGKTNIRVSALEKLKE